MGPHSVNLKFEMSNISITMPSYLFRVTAESANNMDKEIFVYTKTDGDNDKFEGIANTYQLGAIPKDSPDPEAEFPLKFRTSVFEDYYLDPTVIPQLKADYQKRVDALTAALDAAEASLQVEYVLSGILGESFTTNSFLVSP